MRVVLCSAVVLIVLLNVLNVDALRQSIVAVISIGFISFIVLQRISANDPRIHLNYAGTHLRILIAGDRLYKSDLVLQAGKNIVSIVSHVAINKWSTRECVVVDSHILSARCKTYEDDYTRYRCTNIRCELVFESLSRENVQAFIDWRASLVFGNDVQANRDLITTKNAAFSIRWLDTSAAYEKDAVYPGRYVNSFITGGLGGRTHEAKDKSHRQAKLPSHHEVYS